jgi:hypothetical protein
MKTTHGSAKQAPRPAALSMLPINGWLPRTPLYVPPMRRHQQHAGIHRFGVPLKNTLVYYGDVFHTLLHVRGPRKKTTTLGRRHAVDRHNQGLQAAAVVSQRGHHLRPGAFRPSFNAEPQPPCPPSTHTPCPCALPPQLPIHRFVAIFFSIYIAEYCLFALLYLWQPDDCIEGVRHFANALWFSVQTASTIGAPPSSRHAQLGAGWGGAGQCRRQLERRRGERSGRSPHGCQQWSVVAGHHGPYQVPTPRNSRHALQF